MDGRQYKLRLMFKRSIEKLKNKLRSRAGESIGEVLVSLLIAALGLTMLALMITSSGKLLETSKTNFGTYAEAENALSEKPDAYSGTAVTTGSGIASFYNSSDSQILLTDGASGSINVDYFVYEPRSGKYVVSYKAD